MPSTINDISPSGIGRGINSLLGRGHVFLEDLNADISCLRNLWDQQVKYLFASFGMVDLLDNFQQRLLERNLQTWWRVCQGRTI